MRDLRSRSRELGVALYVAVFAVITFVGLTTAMLMVSLANKSEREAHMQAQERRYLAEAGISSALLELTAGRSGAIASRSNPEVLGSGGFHVTVTDHGDTSFTIDSTGTVGGASRTMRCVARDVTQGVYHHAMFAGNRDDDLSYALELGGTGGQADEVSGAIYSGGDIVVSGDATADGPLRAGGTITGADGDAGINQPLPDIAGADYPLNHDVDVASEFKTGGATYTSDSLGGDAWQLPEDNPAHIFRLNPSDRSSEYLATTKDDFFLEDPYESVSTSSTIAAESATQLSLSGIDGEPGASSNDLVFFIDGNLWIHNKKYYSVSLPKVAEGVRVTFVVEGNVYFSDNALIHDSALDGMAFIAIEDETVDDSGNIYFGDARYGTLEQMDAFMYAENDFIDSNLNSSGSRVIEVNGIMSAGNRVAIERDYGDSHTKLDLNYDSRIVDGTLTLPGLPEQASASRTRTMDIISVFEVGADQ